MAITLDQTVSEVSNATATPAALRISTAGPDEIILVAVATENNTGAAAPTVLGISDTGAHAWTFRKALSFTSGSLGHLRIELWWAAAPAAGTYDISVQLSAAPQDAVISAHAFAGVNTTSPFDPLFPYTNVGGTSTGPAKVSGVNSTSAPILNVAFAAANDNTSPAVPTGSFLSTPATGYTGLRGGIAADQLCLLEGEFAVLQNPMSNATVTFGRGWTTGGLNWGILTDGLVPASQPTQTVVSRDVTIEWPIRGLVVQSETIEWPIRGLVHNDAALEWTIQGPIIADVALEWAVQDHIIADAALMWDLRQQVHHDAQLEWDIHRLTITDETFEWPIRHLVPKDNALEWLVRQLAIGDAILEWKVTPPPSPPIVDAQVPIVIARLIGRKDYPVKLQGQFLHTLASLQGKAPPRAF